MQPTILTPAQFQAALERDAKRWTTKTLFQLDGFTCSIYGGGAA